MREIKFRAWDGSEMIFMDMKKNGIYPCGSHKSLMQYTGLKDNNGVEIYEGDILGIPITCFKLGGTSEIEVQKTTVTHEINDHSSVYGHGHSGEDRFAGFKLGGYYGGADNWEVIGNIYENPELLKENE